MLIASVIVFLCISPNVFAQESMRDMDKGPEHHIQFLSEEIQWMQAPASLEPDLKIAVLEGNPSESGVFTLRIKMPDGSFISPHWHPNVERVTVLEGTFLMGSGEEMNKEMTDRLSSGAYTSMPPGMVHFAFADGETIIQLTSVGPWEINYVNPDEHDPRTRVR